MKHSTKKSLLNRILRMRSELHKGQGLIYRRLRLISSIKALGLLNSCKPRYNFTTVKHYQFNMLKSSLTKIWK